MHWGIIIKILSWHHVTTLDLFLCVSFLAVGRDDFNQTIHDVLTWNNGGDFEECRCCFFHAIKLNGAYDLKIRHLVIKI